jgi:hypothetical protein
MKLRIKGNSLRIRLTKTDIENFNQQGMLEERTEFPGAVSFEYAIKCSRAINQLDAEFSHNRITILVPEKIAREWTETEIVGFENKLDIGQGKMLFLLIEKDWVCLDNTFEDQSDHFPNPHSVC